LDGKVAVVTGAASGIGRAIAERFAQEGAVVRVVDRNEKGASAAAQEITATGVCATVHVCDVGNQRGVTELFQELAAQKPIHILGNCAEIAPLGKLEPPTEAAFDPFSLVNEKGPYNCMYAAIESIKANGGGAMVNMVSIAATAGLADRFAYSMSKGAVLS